MISSKLGADWLTNASQAPRRHKLDWLNMFMVLNQRLTNSEKIDWDEFWRLQIAIE